METAQSFYYGRKGFLMQLAPVMLCFFTMGFVDVAGIASIYMQFEPGMEGLNANMLLPLVFGWFLIGAVPAGWIMNRIGRKSVAMTGLLLTTVGMLLPMGEIGYVTVLAAFSLLGVGNAMMQTALNPLVANLIPADRLPSALTFGCGLMSVAALLAPVIAAWGLTTYYPTFGLGWRVLFAIYAVVGVWAISFLGATPIDAERPDRKQPMRFFVKLASHKLMRRAVIGVACTVGIDAAVMVTALGMEAFPEGVTSGDIGLVVLCYCMFRMSGCFLGAFMLRFVSPRRMLGAGVVILSVGIAMLFGGFPSVWVNVGFALAGMGNAAIFPIIFSYVLTAFPAERNEVSGLLVMGMAGGAFVPLLMGLAGNVFGDQCGVTVMMACAGYLFYYCLRLKR